MNPTHRLFLLVLAPMLWVACQPPPQQEPPPAQIPITVHEIVADSFHPSVRLLGRVEPAALLELRADAAGTVAYPARFSAGLRTGESVRGGELVFHVESPEVTLAAVEAELQAEAAEAEVERSRQGVAGGFVSTATHKKNEIQARIARERLSNARAAVARLEVRAPVDGVLRVAESLPRGSRIDPSHVVVELAAEGDLRVEAWASAADLSLLETGLAVVLLDPKGGRMVGRGVLAELANSVDDGGVARVVIGLGDDLGMPSVGDGVEVEALLPERQGVLTVPEESLLVQGGVATVYVLETAGDGFRAASRLVVPGGRHQGRVEILDGLEEGERIAVDGAELLADGLRAFDVERQRKPWES
ncbi:MAG: efflux RND transporter periplasmic adaptor subunit [Thermoanaerobaculia bacterium]|nr:efflux RND transporter periplasmic adaptor subunit [Thermoanaerobaculia bacterium]